MKTPKTYTEPDAEPQTGPGTLTARAERLVNLAGDFPRATVLRDGSGFRAIIWTTPEQIDQHSFDLDRAWPSIEDAAAYADTYVGLARIEAGELRLRATS